MLLVEYAIATKIDDGNKIRVDCTVMETNIHEPTDSSLLVDSVRVLTRLMTRARKYVESPFTNHHRLAKRRGLAILNARTQEDRVPLYQDLLKVTNKTVNAAECLIAALTSKPPPKKGTKPKFMVLLQMFDAKAFIISNECLLSALQTSPLLSLALT